METMNGMENVYQFLSYVLILVIMIHFYQHVNAQIMNVLQELIFQETLANHMNNAWEIKYFLINIINVCALMKIILILMAKNA